MPARAVDVIGSLSTRRGAYRVQKMTARNVGKM